MGCERLKRSKSESPDRKIPGFLNFPGGQGGEVGVQGSGAQLLAWGFLKPLAWWSLQVFLPGLFERVSGQE